MSTARALPVRQTMLSWMRRGDVWIILLLEAVVASFVAPQFLSPTNLGNLMDQSAVTLGVITLGQFIVILSGGFDLSVAGIMAFSGMIAAQYSAQFGPLALPAAIVAGAGLGALNGLLVTKMRIQPFIVTLGMGQVARGLGYAISVESVEAHGSFFDVLGNASIAFVTVPVAAWLALAGATYVLLRFFRVGHYVAAIGGNEATARHSGIDVDGVKLLVYSLSGLMSGVAGVLYVIRSGSGVPLLGTGWELYTIAIVVIAGSDLFGGRGRLTSVLAATLIYVMITNVLNLASVDPYLQNVLAALIVIAVVVLRLLQAGELRGA